MPLFDHFRPPVKYDLPWESLLSALASNLTTVLNLRQLSRDYLALERTHFAPHLEIDVATFKQAGGPRTPDTPNGADAVPTDSGTYAPPETLAAMPLVFPDCFEIRVFTTQEGRRLVGAVELITPGNKDGSQERQAFVAKCGSYLTQGVSVVLLDIVTTRRANLHNELLQFLNAPAGTLPEEAMLYAAAYRPVLRGDTPQLEVWAQVCTLGSALPTMPLRLTGDLFVPVEFEATYLETCRQRRLID